MVAVPHADGDRPRRGMGPRRPGEITVASSVAQHLTAAQDEQDRLSELPGTDPAVRPVGWPLRASWSASSSGSGTSSGRTSTTVRRGPGGCGPGVGRWWQAGCSHGRRRAAASGCEPGCLGRRSPGHAVSHAGRRAAGPHGTARRPGQQRDHGDARHQVDYCGEDFARQGGRLGKGRRDRDEDGQPGSR